MKIFIILFFCQSTLASTLEENYQSEIAFLLAQKNSLATQIRNTREEYTKNITIAENNIKTLQNKLVSLNLSNTKTLAQLSDSEKSLENIQQNLNLIHTTFQQASLSLTSNGSDINPERTNSENSATILNQALNKLKSSTTITKEKGFFYSLNGVKTEGDIIHYGNIAKYIDHNNSLSMLIPAGNNEFKILQTNKPISLQKTTHAQILPIYIFEQSNKAVEVEKEQTFLEMVHAGGTIAYVIVGFGVLATVLVIFRGYFLFKADKNDKELHLALKNGYIENLSTFLSKQQTPLARVLLKTYNNLDRTLEERENVIEESILGEINQLDKFGTMILILASVSPLMGLLGTVTGMIATFDIITQFGTGDPKLLSGGISEALITTKLGLVVAIPSLMLGNIFNGWSNKIKLLMEKEALNLSNQSDKYMRDENVR